jgi:hypothetical protein
VVAGWLQLTLKATAGKVRGWWKKVLLAAALSGLGLLVYRYPFIPRWLQLASLFGFPVVMLLTVTYGYIAVRMSFGDEQFDRPDPDHVRRLRVFEDRFGQNHIAGLTIVRGPFRRLRLLRMYTAFWTLKIVYRGVYLYGKLDRIPSIHFAHWTLFNGKLLFLVNYDGGWDAYLDDFFRTLAVGLSYIWYDTAGFPRTLDPHRLKYWVRHMQTPEVVWYRADVYDGHTVGAINNNTELRRRLLRPRTDEESWARRLAIIGEPRKFWERRD